MRVLFEFVALFNLRIILFCAIIQAEGARKFGCAMKTVRRMRGGSSEGQRYPFTLQITRKERRAVYSTDSDAF